MLPGLFALLSMSTQDRKEKEKQMAEHKVQTPIPGVFYRRPAPDQPEYAQPGDSVTAGQTIGLVEVMKQFSEIKAGVDGTLVTFHVDTEDVIGPGDVIATIETGA
jgi:acetyl-CoA carboxylase biotin carboxyl carrier protein